MATKDQFAVRFNMHLPAVITKKEKWFTANCPIVNVISQGETIEKAKENLAEALTLFFMSCYERGTLSTVLKDCGFKPAFQTIAPPPTKPEPDYVDVPLPFIIDMAKPHRCHA